MGREIKFRAIDWSFKRNWVYGHYFKGNVYPNSEDRDYIYSHDYKVAHGNIEIDISTLGQFTGLTDKNGKEIFEGDIVEHTFYNHSTPNVKFKQEVYFDNGCFCLRSIGKEVDPIEENRNNVPIFWSYAPNVIEVIGNIHES